MALQESKRSKKLHSRETSSKDPDPPLIPAFPDDVSIKILTRLPIQSLKNFKSVSKLWCSCISGTQFHKSRLSLIASDYEYDNQRLLFITSSRNSLHTCPLNDVLNDKSVDALNRTFPFKLPDDNPFISIVGSCNGLVCVTAGLKTPYIWNPTTNNWIKVPCGVRMHYPQQFYGFGYDECNDDYKLVLIYCTHGYSDSDYDFDENSYKYKVKIYSFKSAVWKKLEDFPHHHEYTLSGSGQFTNGALHWEISAPNFPSTIVSINLKNETYGEVLQPRYDKATEDLTLGVIQDSLCVLCDYADKQADVWMLKVYKMNDSWTKLVSIPYLDHFGVESIFMPLDISNEGKVLFRFGFDKLIVYNAIDSSFSIQNIDDCYDAITFVKSVVSPTLRIRNLRKRREKKSDV